MAVPWPLKVQENEKKSTCGSSRRRAGPQGARGPWGPKGPGPARLLEVPTKTTQEAHKNHTKATQGPHKVLDLDVDLNLDLNLNLDLTLGKPQSWLCSESYVFHVFCLICLFPSLSFSLKGSYTISKGRAL